MTGKTGRKTTRLIHLNRRRFPNYHLRGGEDRARRYWSQLGSSRRRGP